MPPPPTVTALPSLRARRCEPRSTVVPKLVRVTVWREGGYCVTFDGGGSTASVLAGVGCASSYTLVRVMAWREGGCCATFDGGG